MESEGFKRKLSAILSADVKGYSRLMGEDEIATIKTLKKYRELIFSLIERYRGRIVDSPGDNLLAEFSSIVDAVECAVKIQEDLKKENVEIPGDRKMEFRIGVNLGDVVEDGERIYGDGVNIAARIEGLADGGGVCISGSAYEQVKNKISLTYESMGKYTVKNISDPISVFKIHIQPSTKISSLLRKRIDRGRKWKKETLAVLLAVLLVSWGLIAWKIFLQSRSSQLEPVSMERMAYPLPDRPSIAILPFTNRSGDPEQEYFSDGLTEDLITDLSKFSGMFVISRNSVFLYKNRAVKPKQVSEELGVRYVLEGSVRKSGDKVRITAQLIDALSGGHLWAERYDQNLKDIFTIQDEIAQQILSALRVNIEKVEQERSFRKETDNLTAFDYNLRGWWYYHRYTKEENNKARKMFKRAIELEPSFASAYAGIGFTYYEQWARLWSEDPQSLEKAYEWAKKSIALDNARAGSYALLGHIYLWRKQYEQAIKQREKAIELDPNNADLYQDLAETLVWAGRPEKAITSIKKAMRLNPHYSVNYEFTLGFAFFTTGQYEDAIEVHKKALMRSPDHWGAHIVMALSYSELGDEDEARYHVKEALRTNPHLSLEVFKERIPLKDSIQSERYAKMLLKEGLPEKLLNSIP